MQFNVKIEINSLNVICSLRSRVRSIVLSVRMYGCLFIESLEKLIMLALFKSVMELNGKLILLTLHGRKVFSRTLLLYLHCITNNLLLLETITLEFNSAGIVVVL